MDQQTYDSIADSIAERERLRRVEECAEATSTTCSRSALAR